jgi:arylsulfatase A
MLLTGKYNFRNYSNWGYFNYDEKTFGNMMQDAGYQTAFFGKVQSMITDSSLTNWGFNKYDVFELTQDTVKEHRYKNPSLVSNEGRLDTSLALNKFSDDILTKDVFNFIDDNHDNPFFIYYPMALCHSPFSPTPDDTAFAAWDPDNDISDTSFFPSMMKYMDKKVGAILQKLRSAGLAQKTIVIFAGDNGFSKLISYTSDDGEGGGEKGTTLEEGTHVPLIAYWPWHIKKGTVNDDLIDFTDLFSTFAEAAHVNNLDKYENIDGLSFYSRMLGQEDTSKQQLFIHYDPHPGFDTLRRWVRDKTYKLYDATGFKKSGSFYNIENDSDEIYPLDDSVLTTEEIAIKQKFTNILDTMATWPDSPVLDSAFAKNITDSSATISAEIISEGASSLIERGSTIDTSGVRPLLPHKRLIDTTVALGRFSQTRSGLDPQTQYNYSLYAMNNNKSHSTNFIRGNFFTLSKAPVQQPSSFTAIADGCTINLKWTGAVFPDSGAAKAGYLLIYSTGMPSLKNNINGKSPEKIVANGSIIDLSPTLLPKLPATKTTLLNLSKDSIYHFLLVPYTSNRNNDLTYNYLTEGALTATSDSLEPDFKLTATITEPLCFQDANGNISAMSTGGISPYLYSINGGVFDTEDIFKNLTAGTYMVIAKDAKSCVDSIAIIMHQPEELRIKNTIQNPSCIGSDDGSITLKGKGGTKPYLYSFNGNGYSHNMEFYSLAAGSYRVKIKDKNGCTDAKTIVLTAENEECLSSGSSHVGINNFVSINNIKVSIYPNPSSSEFELVVKNAKADQSVFIKVFDMYERLLYSAKNQDDQTYHFGQNFIPGTYIIQIQTGNTIKTFKIVKI